MSKIRRTDVAANSGDLHDEPVLAVSPLPHSHISIELTFMLPRTT